MEAQITYDKMFDMIQVKDVIIFEDDFIVKNTKNELCYGLTRINLENRKELMSEVEQIDIGVKIQLEDFLTEFDKVFDEVKDWKNEVPYNDIEAAMKILEEYKEDDFISKIRKRYESIDIENWREKNKILKILSSYGAGLEVPSLYEDLFDEYIQKNAHWERVRVFRDYNASTEEVFKQYVVNAAQEGTILCIIDNQLKNQKCAKEILRCIEKIQEGFGERLNIIGVIYSTYENQDRIDDKIYFEYINKQYTKRKVQAALAKSAYSYMLSELKDLYQEILGLSFDEAVKNKNIAFYLSSMAGYEGVTNYEVITNWIKLLFDYKLSNEDKLFSIARMTQLLNLLDDEKADFSKEMLELNTFEAFDFNVNKFREPIASGDIFVYKKRLLVLIGQDCDMMYSSTRDRKNGISELVTASTVNQSNIDNSVKLNSEYICISNFKKDREGDIRTLKIRYSSREFIENQILQLCQFNDEGKCSIHMDVHQYTPIGTEPSYYDEMYLGLNNYFNSLIKLRLSEREAIETIVNSTQSKRLITLTNYQEEQIKNRVIEYPIRRICRLKHPYMLYLYKMYLEHQGRHPFNCMNMSRIQELQVKIVQDESLSLTVDAVLTPDRNANMSHIGSMDWYVDKSVLEETLSQFLDIPIKLLEGDVNIKIGIDKTSLKCKAESGQIKVVEIQKIDDAVSILENNDGLAYMK